MRSKDLEEQSQALTMEAHRLRDTVQELNGTVQELHEKIKQMEDEVSELRDCKEKSEERMKNLDSEADFARLVHVVTEKKDVDVETEDEEPQGSVCAQVYVYVCIYVCMYVCTRHTVVCSRTWICAHLHTCIYTHSHISESQNIHTHQHTYTHECSLSLILTFRRYVHAYVRAYLHT
jgi:hypothetical protein